MMRKNGYNNLIEKKQTNGLTDKVMLTIYFALLMINVVSRFLIDRGGGELRIVVLYLLCGYFLFFYGKKRTRLGLDTLFSFVIVYVFIMQFIWETDEVYVTHGVTFNRPVWHLVSFLPITVSAMAIARKTDDETSGFIRWVVIALLLFSCCRSIDILENDPLASKLTATGWEDAYIPFLIEYGMVYAIPVLLPYLFAWMGEFRPWWKLWKPIFGVAMGLIVLYCLVQASFVIALAATMVAILAYFSFRFKNRWVRYGWLAAMLVLVVVVFREDWHIKILEFLAEKTDVEQIKKRLIALAAFFKDGTLKETMGRLELYVTSIERIKVHPFMGNIVWNRTLVLSNHSTTLDILDGCGLFVFVLYATFIVGVFLYNYRYKKQKHKAAAIASFLAFLIVSTLNPILASPQIMAFYILGSVIFIGAPEVKKQNPYPTKLKETPQGKTVAQINMVAEGSTGKIMLNIAALARKEGLNARTYSTHVFSTKYKKLPPPPYGHEYYGSYLGNFVHFMCARTIGYNGSHSRFSTRKLIRKLKKQNTKILHLHNLHSFCIHLPSLFDYVRKNNIRLIWTLHDCWAFTGHCPHFDMIGCDKWKTGCYDCPQYKYFPKSYVDTSKRAYARKKKWFAGVQDMLIVTPSKWLAGLVKESFLKDYPVKVINNGIDLSVFKPTKSDFRAKHGIKDEFVLLGVAFGWGERKGLDVFIELAKRLNPRFKIVLVGTSESTDKQLPENIISIHRTQNQQELAEIYTAADLFVNPTREENFPTVNMEALACGTPVITFNTGGSPEMLDETCGVVVEKNDIDGLQREIERIERERLLESEDCIARASRYDMNDKFEEYVALYKEE